MNFARIFLMWLALSLLVVGCSDVEPLGPPVDGSAEADRVPYVPDRPHYCIGDFVWFDSNGNGCWDAEEAGVEGVVVELYSGCPADESIATTVTDENGYYEFCSLSPGDYVVEFVAPDGYVFCEQYAEGCDPTQDSNAGPDGMTDCITLVDADDWTIDAGLCEPTTETYCIGDYVWYDTNGDGCQDMDEYGAEGVVVELYAGCDGGDVIATTMTDADGYYDFCGLMAGDYTVLFFAPDGYEFCAQYADCGPEFDSNAGPDGMTDCITLVDADDWTIDAALCMPPQEGCTHTHGYWKNRCGFSDGNQPDIVTPLLPIWLGDAGGAKSLDVNTALMAYELLTQEVYGNPDNGITKLYAQLLSAKLSIADGASDADVTDAIAEADGFLADHDWNDWADLSEEDQQMVLDWKDHFDAYVNGEIGPGHCD